MNRAEFNINHFQQDFETKLNKLESHSLKGIKELEDRMDIQAKLLQFTNIMQPETDREKFELKISNIVINQLTPISSEMQLIKAKAEIIDE